MPSKAFEAIIAGGMTLTKRDEEPPIYEFSLRGHKKTVRIPLLTLKTKNNVDWAMFGAWDFHPLDDINKKEWRGIIDEWVQSKEIKVIDADEISLSHRIIMGTKRYFEHFGEVKAREDLNLGCHVIKSQEKKDYYCFKEEPLYKWLRLDLGHPVRTGDVDVALAGVGLLRGRPAHPISLGNPGKTVRTWKIPCDKIDSYPARVEEEEEVVRQVTLEEVEKENDESPPDWF